MKKIKIFLVSFLCTTVLYAEEKSLIDKILYTAFDAYYGLKQITDEKKKYILARYEFHKSNNSKKPVDDTLNDLVNAGIDSSKGYYQAAKIYLEKEHQKYLLENSNKIKH